MVHNVECSLADYEAVTSGGKNFQIVSEADDYNVGDFIVYFPIQDGRRVRCVHRFYRVAYIEPFYKDGGEYAILALKAS